ncbi:HAMP domain-containing sensor histidine kinase [Bacillus thuringiensis]|uniref:sensor histidine kinase n=1 Tax=Bacillus thuringiensis TaxID=1428 RepID=UPI000E496AC8|nr:HAMP domain-containing sensor histidine kinase [Bacillus thuringiensis]MDZ3953400.1 HAMP domain-containing sensor histidine kinase [Bacillus thuringiensis]RGP43381.1 two-component sensor histidine kinase [Bacillus thuringiensis]
MTNSSLQILKSIPVWKICKYIFLAICLSYGTLYIIKIFYWGLDATSITFYTVRREISLAYGTGNLQYFFSILYYLSGFCFFLLYVFFFYLHEKKQYLKRYFYQILNEIQVISDSNFEHKIPILVNTHLGDLAKEINSIIKRLKNSIEEELRIEQTKKDLITNLSHDLRTPLTSIVGFVSYIHQDKYKDEIELRYYIEIIYEKVIRLNELMNDLFEYTCFQNKGVYLHKVPINIVEMLEQLTGQFQLELQNVNMELRLFLAERNLMIYADGDKLVRVFENLILNAIRYGSEGEYIDIYLYKKRDLIIIEFVNYGEMIPTSDLSQIFERFYRVEKSRSSYTGGSGLGLAISKSIMELHGGTIEVYSDIEKTTFIVKIHSYQKEAP